jgi:hypothetical protein
MAPEQALQVHRALGQVRQPQQKLIHPSRRQLVVLQVGRPEPKVEVWVAGIGVD